MLAKDVKDMWKFSAICQFVSLFGESLNIPELDISALETQLALLDADGPYVRDFRFSLIKSLSSNRTINQDNMDDFIRRQYTYRKSYPNPLLKVERVWKELFHGTEEMAEDDEGSELGDVEEVEEQTIISWLELTIEERLDVLHRLCEWQLHSEKFRERVGVTTEFQASLWRIEPIGSDASDQIYYFLDDGRLYRCTNPAKSIDSGKKHSKKRKREVMEQNGITAAVQFHDDWKCIASTYDEWQAVLLEFDDPEDDAEERLVQYLKDEALPYIEEIEDARRAKVAALQAKAERIEAERVKEMLRQEMMATRKRSSRIANLDEKREAERRKLEEERKEQEMLARLEQAEKEKEQGLPPVRQTREARIRERELRLYAQRDASQSSRDADLDSNRATPLVVAEASTGVSSDPLETVALQPSVLPGPVERQTLPETVLQADSNGVLETNLEPVQISFTNGTPKLETERLSLPVKQHELPMLQQSLPMSQQSLPMVQQRQSTPQQGLPKEQHSRPISDIELESSRPIEALPATETTKIEHAAQPHIANGYSHDVAPSDDK